MSFTSFSVVHCLNAPDPPPEANLTVRDYDPSSPRRRGGHLNYTCSAGGYNRFASNFNSARYILNCNDDNNYETPNWPTCVSSGFFSIIFLKLEYQMCLSNESTIFSATYCPEPEKLETAEIKFHSFSSNTARPKLQKTKAKKQLHWKLKNIFFGCLIPVHSTGPRQDRIFVHRRVSEGNNVDVINRRTIS